MSSSVEAEKITKSMKWSLIPVQPLQTLSSLARQIGFIHGHQLRQQHLVDCVANRDALDKRSVLLCAPLCSSVQLSMVLKSLSVELQNESKCSGYKNKTNLVFSIYNI